MVAVAEPRYITTELGLEKRCARCREYYPADEEFFFAQKGNAPGVPPLHSWCKACYIDYRRTVSLRTRRR